jgi:hypothetical protein
MKTWYKHWNQRTNVLSSLKEMIRMYREDNYIDDGTQIIIYYNDGTRKRYPDNVEEIKLKNIRNVIFSNGDVWPMDFTYDFIGTQEDYNSMKEICTGVYKMLKPEEYLPKNPLIVDDMDDYYKMQEE